jgi:hypothetical protein
MKYAMLFGALCLLASCATSGGPSGVDFTALESSATTTEPLQFVPEIEPANLRISLFYSETSIVDFKWKLRVGGAPLIQAFGVDLGNGLAIDSAGNVFLDVMKLLKVDMNAPFKVERKPDSLLGSRTTLVRDETGLTLRSPRGRGPLTVTDTGMSLKNPAGKDDMTVKFAEGSWSYHSALAFDQASKMRVAEDRLTISGPVLLHDLVIARDGESVEFNTANDQDFPHYIVTRQGDSYSIQFKNDQVNVTFKVYFTADSIYLTQNGAVALTVKKTDSSIFVNGKEAVTYSKG